MILKNATILTTIRNEEIKYNTDIQILDGKIAKIDKNIVPSKNEEIIDCTKKYITPGFINCHTHIPMSLFKEIVDGYPLQTWLTEAIWPLEAKMTTEDIYKFALLGMVENLENGVTTINDMYFHTQYLIDAAKVAGIDQVTTVTLMDVDGDARGQERIENFRKCFAENPNANFSLGIHGFYTTTPAYIEKCVALAKELNINLVHIHFCENDAEVKEILSRHSAKTPAEILERYFKDFKIVLAHGVILSIDDMERIGKLSASISHNPISNLRLGCGVTDVVNLQKYNVNVGLGTDGDGSGSNQSVLKNARLACLLQKGTYKDPTLIKAENAFEMATINGAKALGLEKSKGTIEVGKDADLNIIDLKTSTTFPVNDIISDIIYNCEAQNIETVIVKGKIVIKDGKHTSIDKQKLFDECQALLERIKKSN